MKSAAVLHVKWPQFFFVGILPVWSISALFVLKIIADKILEMIIHLLRDLVQTTAFRHRIIIVVFNQFSPDRFIIPSLDRPEQLILAITW